MNKILKSHEQLMNKSQTKCEQVVHDQIWARHKISHEQVIKTHKELMNKSQAKCKQVVHEQVMS